MFSNDADTVGPGTMFWGNYYTSKKTTALEQEDLALRRSSAFITSVIWVENSRFS